MRIWNEQKLNNDGALLRLGQVYREEKTICILHHTYVVNRWLQKLWKNVLSNVNKRFFEYEQISTYTFLISN